MGKLKASDAAKEWTSLVDWKTTDGLALSDHRKYLRRDFNNYSHCTNDLCIWNLAFEVTHFDGDKDIRSGHLLPNWNSLVIVSNAHSIDDFEQAHLFEFLNLVRKAYSEELTTRNEIGEIDAYLKGIRLLLDEHSRHNCQDVRAPPEIAQLKL